MSAQILLVDDDDLIRRSLAFTLEQGGYQTITAASAEDALSLVKRDPPDLVLLDIGLPGMDGLQAMRHFQDQGIPVIFLTARRRELDEILGLADTILVLYRGRVVGRMANTEGLSKQIIGEYMLGVRNDSNETIEASQSAVGHG